VAAALGAPLDVIMVRKLGVPSQPELAMGAIGEGGVRILLPETVQQAGITPAVLAGVEHRERAELARRAERFRGDRPRVPLAGRIAVVVDDGIATGSTARAACEVARAQGATHIVVAVPVAPSGWVRGMRDAADELIALLTPVALRSIGAWYTDFSQTTDEEVVACLHPPTHSTDRAKLSGAQ
jgi:putative phosphoribosyl transferase